MRYLILFLGFLSMCQIVFANPVIYQGGQMLDTFVDSKVTDIQWAYSITSREAVGYRYFQPALENSIPLYMVQFNYLINRWNAEESQANIYALSGLGIQQTTLAPYLGIEADWETRKFYVAALTEQFWTQTPNNKIVLRTGIAPYVAEYTALHTWLILQAVQMNMGTELTQWLMPIIRLFKDNILMEFGSNGVLYYASLRIHY